MKNFGYPKQETEREPVNPKELTEITLSATPTELRRIGEFLVASAAEMDRMGETYDHVHLGNRMKEFDAPSPHLVVVRGEVS